MTLRGIARHPFGPGLMKSHPMSDRTIVDRRARLVRSSGPVAAIVTVVVGVVVLLGHLFTIDLIVNPFGTPITVSTALGLIIGGIGIIGWYDGLQVRRIRRSVSITAGIVLAVVALALLVGRLAKHPWGFDVSGGSYPSTVRWLAPGGRG